MMTLAQVGRELGAKWILQHHHFTILQISTTMACLVIMLSMIRFWWELNSSIDILAAVIMMTKYWMTGLQKKWQRPCATTFARKLPEVPTDGTDNLGDQVHSKNKIRLFMKSLWRLVVMSKRRNVKMTRRRKHRLSMLARRETYWQCFELEKKPRLLYTLVKSP